MPKINVGGKVLDYVGADTSNNIIKTSDGKYYQKGTNGKYRPVANGESIFKQAQQKAKAGQNYNKASGFEQNKKYYVVGNSSYFTMVDDNYNTVYYKDNQKITKEQFLKGANCVYDAKSKKYVAKDSKTKVAQRPKNAKTVTKSGRYYVQNKDKRLYYEANGKQISERAFLDIEKAYIDSDGNVAPYDWKAKAKKAAEGIGDMFLDMFSEAKPVYKRTKSGAIALDSKGHPIPERNKDGSVKTDRKFSLGRTCTTVVAGAAIVAAAPFVASAATFLGASAAVASTLSTLTGLGIAGVFGYNGAKKMYDAEQENQNVMLSNNERAENWKKKGQGGTEVAMALGMAKGTVKNAPKTRAKLEQKQIERTNNKFNKMIEESNDMSQVRAKLSNDPKFQKLPQAEQRSLIGKINARARQLEARENAHNVDVIKAEVKSQTPAELPKSEIAKSGRRKPVEGQHLDKKPESTLEKTASDIETNNGRAIVKEGGVKLSEVEFAKTKESLINGLKEVVSENDPRLEIAQRAINTLKDKAQRQELQNILDARIAELKAPKLQAQAPAELPKTETVTLEKIKPAKEQYLDKKADSAFEKATKNGNNANEVAPARTVKLGKEKFAEVKKELAQMLENISDLKDTKLTTLQKRIDAIQNRGQRRELQKMFDAKKAELKKTETQKPQPQAQAQAPAELPKPEMVKPKEIKPAEGQHFDKKADSAFEKATKNGNNANEVAPARTVKLGKEKFAEVKKELAQMLENISDLKDTKLTTLQKRIDAIQNRGQRRELQKMFDAKKAELKKTETQKPQPQAQAQAPAELPKPEMVKPKEIKPAEGQHFDKKADSAFEKATKNGNNANEVAPARTVKLGKEKFAEVKKELAQMLENISDLKDTKLTTLQKRIDAIQNRGQRRELQKMFDTKKAELKKTEAQKPQPQAEPQKSAFSEPSFQKTKIPENETLFEKATSNVDSKNNRVIAKKGSVSKLNETNFAKVKESLAKSLKEIASEKDSELATIQRRIDTLSDKVQRQELQKMLDTKKTELSKNTQSTDVSTLKSNEKVGSSNETPNKSTEISKDNAKGSKGEVAKQNSNETPNKNTETSKDNAKGSTDEGARPNSNETSNNKTGSSKDKVKGSKDEDARPNSNETPNNKTGSSKDKVKGSTDEGARPNSNETPNNKTGSSKDKVKGSTDEGARPSSNETPNKSNGLINKLRNVDKIKLAKAMALAGTEQDHEIEKPEDYVFDENETYEYEEKPVAPAPETPVQKVDKSEPEEKALDEGGAEAPVQDPADNGVNPPSDNIDDKDTPEPSATPEAPEAPATPATPAGTDTSTPSAGNDTPSATNTTGNNTTRVAATNSTHETTSSNTEEKAEEAKIKEEPDIDPELKRDITQKVLQATDEEDIAEALTTLRKVGRFKGRKNLRRLLKAKRKHNEERVAKYQQKVEANKEQVNEAFKEKYEKKYFDA